MTSPSLMKTGRPFRRIAAVGGVATLSLVTALARRPVPQADAWNIPLSPVAWRAEPAEPAPGEPQPWPERGDVVAWELFTPPELRWDVLRGEWTEEPEEPVADVSPGGEDAAEESRVEIVGIGACFLPVQLVGHARVGGTVAGIFEIGPGRAPTVAAAGTTWPALGLRVESVDVAPAAAEEGSGGRGRARLRDLATGERIELDEGRPGLRGQPRAWLRWNDRDGERALAVGEELRAGAGSVRLEGIDVARRSVRILVEDVGGAEERTVERVPLRRVAEEVP